MWDDRGILSESNAIEDRPLLSALTDNGWNPVGGASFYRPVVFWSHRADLALWGRSPAGHHFTNALAFALVTYGLARLLFALTPSLWGVLAGLLYWLIHPAHGEVVDWISGRSDLLAAAGGMAFLALAWPRDASAARLALAFAALALGLLGKEVAIAFPVALIAAALPDRRHAGKLAGLTGLLLAVYLLMRSRCAGLAHGYPFGPPASLQEFALVQAVNLRLLGRYLAMLVTGRDYGLLAFSEMITERRNVAGGVDGLLQHELDLEVALAGIAVLALIPAAIRLWRGSPADRLGLVLIVLPLLLSMNLGTARQQINFSDRYAFVPTIGVALILSQRVSGWVVLALLIAIGPWMRLGVEHRQRYASEVGFWELAVQKNPGSLHAWHMRGLTLLNIGERSEGIAALRAAWSLGHDPQTRAVLDRVAN